MRRAIAMIGLLSWTTLLVPALTLAQTTSPDCETLRQRLAEHARLSDGVRQALQTQVGSAPMPAATPAPATPAPAGAGTPTRADTVHARLEAIPKERQVLEDQRLAAAVKFDLARAAQIQGQIQTLDTEKTLLEKELATLPAGTGAPASGTSAPATSAPAGSPPPHVALAQRVQCLNMIATVDNAVKIRQRELGAKEGQPGVIPLMGFRNQAADQIARDLASQFAAWPDAAVQVG